MLPRVSAALKQFLSPIKAPGKATSSQKNDGGGHSNLSYSGNPEKKEEQKSQTSKPTESVAQQKADQDDADLNPNVGPTLEQPHGVLMFDLFAKIKETSEKAGQVFGMGSYRKASKTQKKNAKFRKGAVLDKKVG